MLDYVSIRIILVKNWNVMFALYSAIQRFLVYNRIYIEKIECFGLNNFKNFGFVNADNVKM